MMMVTTTGKNDKNSIQNCEIACHHKKHRISNQFLIFRVAFQLLCFHSISDFSFEWLRCALCIFQLLLIRVICLGKIVLLLGTHINFAFVERDRDFVSVTTKRDVMRKAINEMGTFSTAPENFIILFLLLSHTTRTQVLLVILENLSKDFCHTLLVNVFLTYQIRGNERRPHRKHKCFPLSYLQHYKSC